MSQQWLCSEPSFENTHVHNWVFMYHLRHPSVVRLGGVTLQILSPFLSQIPVGLQSGTKVVATQPMSLNRAMADAPKTPIALLPRPAAATTARDQRMTIPMPKMVSSNLRLQRSRFIKSRLLLLRRRGKRLSVSRGLGQPSAIRLQRFLALSRI